MTILATTISAGQLAASLQQASCYAHWLRPTRGGWLMPLLRTLTASAAWIGGHLARIEMRGDD